MKSLRKDFLFTFVLCGGSLISLGQGLVSVHGHQLFLSCEGPSASPTVILMAGGGGGGGTTKIWDKVQPQVTTFARMCSYDRAGLGESSAIKEPQSAAEIADDLAALLETVHVPTPYILVGTRLEAFMFANTINKRIPRSQPWSSLILLTRTDMAFCEDHARGPFRVPAVEKHEGDERTGLPPS
jgi:hypothetical protein